MSQSVSISRCGGILRNAERTGDFVKSEIVPNFQDKDLPLIMWQAANRCGKGRLPLVCEFKLRLNRGIGLSGHCGFPSETAFVATDKVQSNGTHRRVKQSSIGNCVVSPPKFDKSLLHNVFSISC